MADDGGLRQRRRRFGARRFAALVGGLAGAGALVTWAWFAALPGSDSADPALVGPALLSFGVCLVLTTLNLMTRWFRWHFLLRRFTPELATRDSLAVYLATLPAIISPFCLAELVRVWLLRRRLRAPAAQLVRIWLTERGLDAGVLGTALLGSLDGPLGVLAGTVLALGAFAALRSVPRGGGVRRAASVTATALGATLLAWSLPVVALFATLRLLGGAGGIVTALRAFAAGTLLGGASGLPLGIGVTGSTMIWELLQAGLSARTAVLSILVYRAGTAWFAVALGLLAAVLFRGRLARLLGAGARLHFDDIAGAYAAEIPQHVQQRLLQRKVQLIDRTLRQFGVPRGARGLDVGCGQGWYVEALSELGYGVDGVDVSAQQLLAARAGRATSAVRTGAFLQADARQLPFESGTYDFVYSVNALHHMLAPEAQSAALAEIVRVLRPGGVFVLHEINTHNPLFRWYMGYLFPLLRRIDEGNEAWLLPTALPEAAGAGWRQQELCYFTFLPDFAPSRVLGWFGGIEARLEASRFARFGAHYQACLVKLAAAPDSQAQQPRPKSALLSAGERLGSQVAHVR